jgi:hypothetical protein
MIRCSRPELAEVLATLTLPEHSLVFVTDVPFDAAWEHVMGELAAAFEMSQSAVRDGGSVLYVIEGDDLLGRRGPARAMVACGLLSASRTLALETAKAGVPVNVIAMAESYPVESAGSWVEALCRPGGPHGDLIQLGTDHLGKALP